MYFVSYWIAFVLNFIRSIFESARKLIGFLSDGVELDTYFVSYWIAFVLNFIQSTFESACKRIALLFDRMELDTYSVSYWINFVLNFIQSIFESACKRIALLFDRIRLSINSLKNNQNPFNENQIVLLNPATGLPMISGDTFGFDTAGNRFGENKLLERFLFERLLGTDINPATGLPMISQYSGVDVAGNPYGFDVHRNDSFSSFDSSSSFDLNSGIGSSFDLSSTGNINSLSDL